jgi:hypothetical protein
MDGMLWSFGASWPSEAVAAARALRVLLVAATLPALGLGLGHAARGQPAEAIASQKAHVDDVVAEITRCQRKDDVLTVVMELRNTGGQEVSFYPMYSNNYDDYYFTAKNKKYLMLRDTEDKPLARAASNTQIKLKPGQSWTWWAKYPAPPPDVTSVTYYTYVTLPFEDLPISG